MECDFRSEDWNNQIHKALVTLAIEQTLTEIGKPMLEKVCSKLFQEHHCYLPDCYGNPQYLNKVLKEIFGASYIVVVEAIGDNLKENLTQISIKRFLEIIIE